MRKSAFIRWLFFVASIGVLGALASSQPTSIPNSTPSASQPTPTTAPANADQAVKDAMQKRVKQFKADNMKFSDFVNWLPPVQKKQ